MRHARARPPPHTYIHTRLSSNCNPRQRDVQLLARVAEFRAAQAARAADEQEGEQGRSSGSSMVVPPSNERHSPESERPSAASGEHATAAIAPASSEPSATVPASTASGLAISELKPIELRLPAGLASHRQTVSATGKLSPLEKEIADALEVLQRHRAKLLAPCDTRVAAPAAESETAARGGVIIVGARPRLGHAQPPPPSASSWLR